jgi:hypothetical protein
VQPASFGGQKLWRWLLLSLDRLPSKELSMTQELIAKARRPYEHANDVDGAGHALQATQRSSSDYCLSCSAAGRECVGMEGSCRDGGAGR